jgi:hypothetical protein
MEEIKIYKGSNNTKPVVAKENLKSFSKAIEDYISNVNYKVPNGLDFIVKNNENRLLFKRNTVTFTERPEDEKELQPSYYGEEHQSPWKVL